MRHTLGFLLLLAACGGAIDSPAPGDASPDASPAADGAIEDVSRDVETSSDARAACRDAGAPCVHPLPQPCEDETHQWQCVCSAPGCKWVLVTVPACTGPSC